MSFDHQVSDKITTTLPILSTLLIVDLRSIIVEINITRETILIIATTTTTTMTVNNRRKMVMFVAKKVVTQK